jgi:hypothetical protein
MDWMKIVSAGALVLMLVVMIPRAKDVFANTPKASGNDWQAAILPILVVMGFVAFLLFSR